MIHLDQLKCMQEQETEFVFLFLMFSVKKINTKIKYNMKKKINKKTNSSFSEKEIEILDTLREKVWAYLKSRKYEKATEVVVKDILKHEHIWTLRSDVKPEFWIYKNGIIVPEGKTFVIEKCRKILGPWYSVSFPNDVLSKIQADTYTDQNSLFKEEDLDLIAVENGILNLKTKELLDFSPNYRFFNKLPVKYVPGIECKKIIKFLTEVLESVEDLQVIQELFGFLLVREYFIEKSFFFWGTGRNGKSKLMTLIKNFLGNANCVEISLQTLEKDQFALSELFKKLANLSGDLSHEALENTGNFKKLTGRDLISASRKFKVMIHFINYGKLIFAGNEIPETKDLTPAFFLRWIILKFPYIFLPPKDIETIPEEKRENVRLQNPHIIEDICDDKELSGLLNWALQGLERLRDKKEFSYSKSTAEVEKQWKRTSSSVQGFLMDCCIVNPNDTSKSNMMTKEQFAGVYADYCKKNSFREQSNQDICEIMRKHGIESDRASFDGVQKRVWLGIKFKQENKKNEV